jgi:precorrin-8X/cobalt-precorrin-8 methylmutase
MTSTGVIVLVHGSRGKVGRIEVESSLQRIVGGLRGRLASGIEVEGAALQFNNPSLEESVATLAGRGVKRVIIVPYFLFAGRHITEHVPLELADLQPMYPDIKFILADVMGMDDSFISLIARRVGRAAPDLLRPSSGSKGNSIESESMKIVDSLLPPSLTASNNELQVIRRMVHACGDPGAAELVRFSQGAVGHGVEAILKGRQIITDVRMLMAGIDMRLAAACGCDIACAMDYADAGGVEAEPGTTRAAAAINFLGSRLDGSIAAIGNAPTALLALIELIDRGTARPALVVGMPVGFVKADEAKEALMKRDVPYITVTGTRGGSPMAAAAVNALLRLAKDKDVTEVFIDAAE